MLRIVKSSFAIVLALVLVAGCANSQATRWGTTALGAGGGAAAGRALAGKGNETGGTIIGGVVGAAGGYLLGDHLASNQENEAENNEFENALALTARDGRTREFKASTGEMVVIERTALSNNVATVSIVSTHPQSGRVLSSKTETVRF